MNKAEKEKFIAELRLKEIEGIDRDETVFVYKWIAGISATVLLLNTLGFFSESQIKNYILAALASLFIIFIWFGQNMYKHITDCYNLLADAIKNNTIETFESPRMVFFDYLWYRRKEKIEKLKAKASSNLFWSIIDVFVNILTAIAVIMLLSQTIKGFWMLCMVALFLAWAFRPGYLAIKEYLGNDK